MTAAAGRRRPPPACSQKPGQPRRATGLTHTASSGPGRTPYSSRGQAKNTTAPASKLAVLQLANYLSRHGTGLFGMLLTRHGPNESARWTRREHWVLHDKMIIGPDDEDMQQMLLTKLAGNNPADLIQQRIEDFRLRI